MSEAVELAAKLRFEGVRLADYLEGLSASQWSTDVYADGSIWSVRSVLAHLMSAERAFVKLFADIRDGGPGVSEDFVIDRYNASQQRKTAPLSPPEVLHQYRVARAQMVVLVSALNDADLEKRGRHPHLGSTSLREMIKMVYIHNQMHLRDIRRALRP